MSITLNVPQYSVTEDTVYWNDLFEEHKKLGAKPQAINLEAFIQKCIPDMISGSVYFGAFYDGNRQGLVVTGDKLRWDLIEEINLVWE